MATETKTCATCRFWEFRGRAVHRTYGECMRYPPATAREDDNRFPLTGDDIWCGEHQPREDTESAEASTA